MNHLILIVLLLSSAKNSSQWLQKFCEGNFAHQEEMFNSYNRCSSDHFLHMQFQQSFDRFGILKIRINDTTTIKDLLLHIHDGHGSFVSLKIGSVRSCKYENDTFHVENQNVTHEVEISLDHLKENAIIRYFMLSRKSSCFYEGKKTTNFEMPNKLSAELHKSLRYKRQASINGEEYLLVAHTDKIYRVTLDGENKQSLVTNLRRSVAIDYDVRRNKMYWTDVNQRVLMQSSLNGNGVTTLLDVGVLIPDGLAVDWTTNKLYFTDTGLDVVCVFDPTLFFYKTLINTGQNTEPRAIVVDPTTRYMYWTDWGTTARIERASMDGTNRQVLHNTGLVWPNGITLDIETQNLYWVDANLDRVETSRVDGSLRRVIASSGLSHPFGIAKHENTLYISDWIGNSIRVMNTSGGPPEILTNVSTCARLAGITVVSTTRQVTAFNPCDISNGGCSHFCLLSTAISGYSCACPDGMELINSTCTGSVNSSLYVVPKRVVPGSCALAGYGSSCCRGVECQGVPTNCYCDTNCHIFGDCCSDVHNDCLTKDQDPYLIVAEARSMRLIDAKNLSRFRTILSNLNTSFSVDYNYRQNLLFWSDISAFSGIWKSNLDGTGVSLLLRSSNIISGIAVDRTSDKIYWGDYVLNSINVMDMTTRNQTTLVQVNGVYRPIQLIVDPKSRLVFWGTQIHNGEGGVIYRVSMDGGRSAVAILASFPHAVSIALDSSKGVLYWTSGDQLGSVLINGSDYRVITSQLQPTFKYMTLVSSNLIFMAYGYNATLIFTNGTIKQNSTEYIGCDNFRFSALINPNRQTKDVSRQALPLKIIQNCPSKAHPQDISLEVIKLLQSEFNINSIGLAKQYAALSCSEVFRISPLRKAGFYWIRNGNDIIKQFCER